jgi:hypothetical protein
VTTQLGKKKKRDSFDAVKHLSMQSSIAPHK